MGHLNSLIYNSYGKLIIDNKTIFDYSNVNVTSNDVKSGLKYVDKTGGIITGTMPSIGNKTYIPTTTEQILPVNTLIGPNVKVAGDQNLVSSKILENTSIFGVPGSVVPSPIIDYSIPGFHATCVGGMELDSAFSGNTKIVGVEFNNCTDKTALSMCYSAYNLQYVYNFPSSLNNAYLMFFNCTNLKYFMPSKLPSSLTNAFQMFYNCTKLTSANFLQEGISMAYQMFYNCRALTYVETLPASLTNTYQMFASCTNLKTINVVNCQGLIFRDAISDIRGYLTTVGTFSNSNIAYAFYDTYGLTNFGGFSNNANNATFAYMTFYNTALNSATSNINLPNTVTNAVECYESTKNIHDVILPTALKDGQYMFQYSNIKNVYGSASKLTNAYQMFYNCRALTYVETLPASLTNVSNMFNYCTNLKTINNVSCQGSIFRGAISSVRGYLKHVNNIINLVNGYQMFDSCTALNYVNFSKSKNTLTSMSYMFSSSKTDNVIGFNADAEKIDFTSLTNCYCSFSSFNGTNQPNIRISTAAAGAFNASSFASYSSNIRKVIFNAPNATSVNLYQAFYSVTTLTNLYLNIKVVPSMASCFYGKSSGVRLNIYIPSGSAINTAFYNSGMSSTSYFPQAMSWTLNSDGSYYNATYNYYIYPTLNSSSTI